MRATDKTAQVLKRVLKGEKARTASVEAYPESVIETVIFHKLHQSMAAGEALESFERLRTEFVDWNEIRVSTIQEIREHLGNGENTLDTAVFIKGFLEFVHRERQCMDLEYLVDENLTDVRRFLRQVRGIDVSTIDLVLQRCKGHPVFPLNPASEAILVAAGLARREDTRDRKAKSIYEILDEKRFLPFHHFLLDLERELNPIEEETLSGARVYLRSACNSFVKGSKSSAKKKKTGAPRGRKAATKGRRKASRT